jgi:hypothetical protein
MLGADMRLPFDTTGLAPKMSRKWVRSTSGTESRARFPKLW